MKQSILHGSHLKHVRIWLHRDNRPATVRGYDVRPEAFTQVPFGVMPCHVHRDYFNDGRKAKTWAVTDSLTGACVTHGQPSADAAIYRAAMILSGKTLAVYHEAQRKCLDTQTKLALQGLAIAA